MVSPSGRGEDDGRDRSQRRERAESLEVVVVLDLSPELFGRNIKAENDPWRPSLLECVGDGPAARNCGIEQAIADRIALLFSDQRERLRNEEASRRMLSTVLSSSRCALISSSATQPENSEKRAQHKTCEPLESR